MTDRVDYFADLDTRNYSGKFKQAKQSALEVYGIGSDSPEFGPKVRELFLELGGQYKIQTAHPEAASDWPIFISGVEK